MLRVFPEVRAHLAHSKSALKRWRQNERHRERNKPYRTGARSAVKKAAATIDAGTPEDAAAAIRDASSIIDRAARRRVIHPNAAARHKSRLMRRLHASSAAPGSAEAPRRARKTATKKSAAKKTAAKKPATRARKSAG
jgi:small subunit ribosomal protein S20